MLFYFSRLFTIAIPYWNGIVPSGTANSLFLAAVIFDWDFTFIKEKGELLPFFWRFLYFFFSLCFIFFFVIKVYWGKKIKSCKISLIERILKLISEIATNENEQLGLTMRTSVETLLTMRLPFVKLIPFCLNVGVNISHIRWITAIKTWRINVNRKWWIIKLVVYQE